VTTTPAELEATAALLNAVFEHDPPLTPDALRWYYDDNPAGVASVGRVELDGAAPGHPPVRVGNYALVPQEFARAGSPSLRLGVGVDLAVAPEARGAGTFRRTVEDAYARGRADGLDGILGVANANSAPRMVAALGWRALDALPVTLCRPSARPARDVVHHAVTPELLASPLFDRLCAGGFEQPDDPGRYAPRWTPEGLRWRLARPGAHYVLHVWPHVLAVSSLHHGPGGVRVAMVVKVLARTPLERPVPIGTVARALAGHHRTPLVVHWGRNPHLAVSGVGLPQERMPSPLALVLFALGDRLATDTFELAALEFLDFDAY
jgi:GNAT superfamily N-acetyltransferase